MTNEQLEAMTRSLSTIKSLRSQLNDEEARLARFLRLVDAPQHTSVENLSQAVLEWVVANPGRRASDVTAVVAPGRYDSVSSALKKHQSGGRLINRNALWFPVPKE